MIIKTKYHGEKEIIDQEIWHFEYGVPGFPKERQFVTLPLPDNSYFLILQSVQTVSLAFVIANPFVFFSDYEFKIDDSSIEQLGLMKESDTLVYTILTVENPFEKTTANLQAPLILNVNNRKAKQLILTETNYRTKHPIAKQTASKG